VPAEPGCEPGQAYSSEVVPTPVGTETWGHAEIPLAPDDKPYAGKSFYMNAGKLAADTVAYGARIRNDPMTVLLSGRAATR